CSIAGGRNFVIVGLRPGIVIVLDGIGAGCAQCKESGFVHVVQFPQPDSYVLYILFQPTGRLELPRATWTQRTACSLRVDNGFHAVIVACPRPAEPVNGAGNRGGRPMPDIPPLAILLILLALSAIVRLTVMHQRPSATAGGSIVMA